MRRRSNRHADTPNLFSLRCDECDSLLVTTDSGYLACPRGHGKLIDQRDDVTLEPCGSLFDAFTPEEK